MPSTKFYVTTNSQRFNGMKNGGESHNQQQLQAQPYRIDAFYYLQLDVINLL